MSDLFNQPHPRAYAWVQLGSAKPRRISAYLSRDEKLALWVADPSWQGTFAGLGHRTFAVRGKDSEPWQYLKYRDLLTMVEKNPKQEWRIRFKTDVARKG